MDKIRRRLICAIGIIGKYQLTLHIENKHEQQCLLNQSSKPNEENSEHCEQKDQFKDGGYREKLHFPIEGNEYLISQTDCLDFKSVLDIGLGNGCASIYFAQRNKNVTALGLAIDSYELDWQKNKELGIEIIEEFFEKYESDKKYDAIWMSHVLEHTQNVGAFLEKAKNMLSENGWLFVMVPPFKHEVVGGHVSNGWNLGQLMYNLLISGFNIKNGHFIRHGYNICAFVQVSKEKLPNLRRDCGDIELTKHLWPIDVFQAFNGNLEKINWFE